MAQRSTRRSIRRRKLEVKSGYWHFILAERRASSSDVQGKRVPRGRIHVTLFTLQGNIAIVQPPNSAVQTLLEGTIIVIDTLGEAIAQDKEAERREGR